MIDTLHSDIKMKKIMQKTKHKMCFLSKLKNRQTLTFQISMSETSWNFDIFPHIKENDFMLFTKICILNFIF